jgi:hypothetical protein
MPDVWVIVAAVAAVPLALGLARLARLARRREGAPAEFADGREEGLARRLAREVGCAPAQALPAVRRELGIAPHLPDGTLLKRAAYHYQRELPEKQCRVYRDRAAG